VSDVVCLCTTHQDPINEHRLHDVVTVVDVQPLTRLGQLWRQLCVWHRMIFTNDPYWTTQQRFELHRLMEPRDFVVGQCRMVCVPVFARELDR